MMYKQLEDFLCIERELWAGSSFWVSLCGNNDGTLEIWIIIG